MQKGTLSAWTEGNTSQMSVLQRKLLQGYDKETRPSHQQNAEMILKFGLSLNNIHLNEKEQSMSVYIWLIFSWMDKYLVWNPDDYEGLDLVRFSPNQIWLPDFSLYNSKEVSSYAIKSRLPLIVNPDGKVLWFPPFWGEVPCEMSFEQFPKDVQTCEFVFRSWAHRGEPLRFQMRTQNSTEGIFLTDYEVNSRWSLLDASIHVSTIEFGEEDTLITLKLTVQRNLSKIVSFVISSGFALILVVILSYGLPLRFHLIRIMFHVFPLFLFMISAISFLHFIQSSGDRIPVIVSYYIEVTTVTTLSLIATIFLCHEWIPLTVFSYCISMTNKTLPTTRISIRERFSGKAEGMSYETLEESEHQDENDVSVPIVTSSKDNSRRILVLQGLNFVVGFSFAVIYLTMHFRLKTSIL